MGRAQDPQSRNAKARMKMNPRDFSVTWEVENASCLAFSFFSFFCRFVLKMDSSLNEVKCDYFCKEPSPFPLRKR